MNAFTSQIYGCQGPNEINHKQYGNVLFVER